MREVSDPLDHPEARLFLKRANEKLLPMIKGSALTVGMWSGDPDPKQAIEMGYSVLLDKPIIIVVMNGVHVPEKVVKIADAIIEWTEDQEVLAARINETVERVLGPSND